MKNSKNDEKKQVFHKQVWKRNNENKCLVGFTCFRTNSANSRNIDNDCSKHMTGDENILSNFKVIN